MKTNNQNLCQEIRDLASSDPEVVKELSPELERHVHECVACQAEVGASERLVRLLDRSGSAFSLSVSPEQLAKTARAAGKLRQPERRSGWLLRPAIGLAAVFALVVVVGGGIWWLRGDEGGGGQGHSVKNDAAGGARLQVVSAEKIDRAGKRTALPEKNAKVETTAGERALLTLSEGTRVWLNENTQVAFTDATDRSMKLEAGEVLLDVVRQKDLPPLLVRTSSGQVDVVGTRLLVSQLAGMAVVNVLRGHVIAKSGNRSVDVRAGGEAILRGDEVPISQAAANLGYAAEWASDKPETPDQTSGFGRLKARRPGAGADTELALRLIDHAVDVKIQGRIVRTEVEEEFMNDSDDTLEGIYTFPMPPDAQIAGLDLVVEGKWEHGAIVARDQGDKIWAGVLRNAAPRQQKKEVVEYVWVPGPWHDPALLNWKKGSQFELKIFPIPKKGSRRVRIAYTQVLEPIPGGSRYVLPLAAGAQDKVSTEKFSLVATIGGISDVGRLRIAPFAPERKQESSTGILRMIRENFRPEGDLVIDIPDEKPGREIRAWSYKQPEKPGADGYALVALKPILPAYNGSDPLHLVLVVDRSYSVQKARLQRAAEVARLLVGELGGSHRVSLLACNHQCAALIEDQAASDVLAEKIFGTITSLEAAGSSSLDATLDAVGKIVTLHGEKAVHTRFVLLGDGIPSVGETDPARLGRKTAGLVGRARLTTVGLGGETDEVVLRSLAKNGNGSMLGLTPGTRVAALAWRVLQRQLGIPVTKAQFQFPEGVTQLAPEKTDLIWPGEELLLAMRVPTTPVEGAMVITGELEGVPFKREYQVKLEPVTTAGNAFVPRIWAQGRIDDLQAAGGGAEMVREIVQLSKDYHVLSRHTSLLVLESPAMAKAFGVADTRPAVDWTGTEESQEAEVSGPAPAPGKGMAMDSMTMGGRMPAMSAMSAPPAAKMERSMEDEMIPREMARSRRGRRMIRMKKEWYRVAAITAGVDSAVADWTEVQKKRAELAEKPESRDRMQSLVRTLMQAGQLEEARKLAQKWLEKDAMDAEALVVLAELALLGGQANKAIELLESAIDANPGSEAAHDRMFGAYRALGEFSMMCAHAVPRALVAPKNWEHQVVAAQCTQDTERFFGLLTKSARTSAERKMNEEARPRIRPDSLNLEAAWEGDAQLDLIVLTPDGRVVSFAGGSRRLQAQSVQSKVTEQLATSMEKRGRYQIFVVPRTGSAPSGSVKGSVKIVSYGTTRLLPFAAGSTPLRVADVVVSSKSRLVPAPFGPMDLVE